MLRPRLAPLLLAVTLACMSGLAIRADNSSESDKKHPPDPIERNQQLVNEAIVDTRDLQKEMPLGQLLKMVNEQFPKEKKMSVRIDADAFGDKQAALAATPIKLNRYRVDDMASVRWVLEKIINNSKTPVDYRINGTGVILTTPERALYTRVYDIRDVLAKPVPLPWDHGGQARNADRVDKATQLLRAIESELEGSRGKLFPSHPETIQIQNGNRLIIHAAGSKHSAIDDVLAGIRRMNDKAVILQARLYEVDDAFYSRLKYARPHTLTELERAEQWPLLQRWFPDLYPHVENLYSFLEMVFTILDKVKTKLVLTGDEIRLDDFQELPFLSRHVVTRCLPSPEAARRGDKTRQTVVEGVSFLAEVQVTPDRRYIRMKMTEKAADLVVIDRKKVMLFDDSKEVDAEEPFVKETITTTTHYMADGGTILIPVQYRPQALKASNRWWVLTITPRIYIEEEERIRRGGFQR